MTLKPEPEFNLKSNYHDDEHRASVSDRNRDWPGSESGTASATGSGGSPATGSECQ